jgi:hypothetical protein
MKTLRLLARDPGVWLALATLAVEGRTIVRLRRILATRAAFDRIIAGT